MRLVKFAIMLGAFFSQWVFAETYTYGAISKRFSDVKINEKEVKRTKMEGECLVGLKNLNFKKRKDFDPVAEWTNYRSISLLAHMPPCKVLIIMEIAKSKLENN